MRTVRKIRLLYELCLMVLKEDEMMKKRFRKEILFTLLLFSWCFFKNAVYAEEEPYENEDILEYEGCCEEYEEITEEPGSQEEYSEEDEACEEEQTETEESLSGFQVIDGNTYYFDPVSGECLYGMQKIGSDWYYFDETGMMRSGFIWMDTLKQTSYFAPESGKMLFGRQLIEGKYYYLNEETGAVSSGLIEENGSWYFVDERSGEKTAGQVLIDGSWYCFDTQTYEMITGFHYFSQEKKTVYYDPQSGKMVYGEIQIGDYHYYFDTFNGAMAIGFAKIGNKTSYFDENGHMLYGEHLINDEYYYFDETTGAMITGFTYLSSKGITVYYSSSGKKLFGDQFLFGSWYFFDYSTGARYSGFRYTENNDVLSYYDTDGKLKVADFTLNGNRYYVKADGTIINPYHYSVPYYSQADSRWGSKKYGSWTMAATGCVPTSIAMALSGVTGKTILPSDVATWLYNNTSEFNKRSSGGSGYCAPKAAAEWGVQVTPVNSLAVMKAQLQMGKVLTCAMNPGLFAPTGYTHMITLTAISGDNAYVVDPLHPERNGWYNAGTLWSQRSTDPEDNYGGYVCYAYCIRWYA